MPVPGGLSSLSTAAASNFPDGSTELPSVLDNYMRTDQALFKRKASGSPTTISATLTLAMPDDYGYVEIAGSGEIVDIADTFTWNGWSMFARFNGVATLSHSTNFALPGQAQIVTAAGDMAIFVRRLSGDYEVVSYVRRSGAGIFSSIQVSGAASFSSVSVAARGSFSAITVGSLLVSSVTHDGVASFSSVGVGGSFDAHGPASFSTSIIAGGTLDVKGTASFSATVTAAKVVAVGEMVAASFSGVAVATQAQMEAGTSTGVLVTPNRQQFHQSAAKAWVQYDETGGMQSSYNVVSVTDNAVGNLSPVWATDFSSVNHVVVATTESASTPSSATTFIAQVLPVGRNAGGCNIVTIRMSDFTLIDVTNVNVVAFGDQ